jgi:hypothetical protein
MQLAITFIAVVVGLAFSLAVAVATEELIFGRLMRLFFRPPTTARSGTREQIKGPTKRARKRPA